MSSNVTDRLGNAVVDQVLPAPMAPGPLSTADLDPRWQAGTELRQVRGATQTLRTLKLPLAALTFACCAAWAARMF